MLIVSRAMRATRSGTIVKRFAFDAWGKRIDPATGAATPLPGSGRSLEARADEDGAHTLEVPMSRPTR